MDYDDLERFLADDERRLSEQEKEWNNTRETIRKERAETLSENVSVNRETVAWTAQNVNNRLEDKLRSLRADIDNVETERKRDESDVAFRAIILIGAILLYPALMLIFGAMADSFKKVLRLVYAFFGAVAIVWTLREFLNSLTKYLVRRRRSADKLVIDGLKVLTYEQEKIFIEEQILRINKFLKEAKELERRSENKGGLTDREYERLQVLRYQEKEILKGYTKEFTFFGYLRGIIGK